MYKTPQKQHFPAITEPDEVARLLNMLDAYQGTATVRTALKLPPLVFVSGLCKSLVKGITGGLVSALGRVTTATFTMWFLMRVFIKPRQDLMG